MRGSSPRGAFSGITPLLSDDIHSGARSGWGRFSGAAFASAFCGSAKGFVIASDEAAIDAGMALAARTEDGGGSTRPDAVAAMPVSVNGVGGEDNRESDGAGGGNGSEDDCCDDDVCDGEREGGREDGGIHEGVVGANEDEEGDEGGAAAAFVTGAAAGAANDMSAGDGVAANDCKSAGGDGGGDACSSANEDGG
ncbi:hypothetical protein LMG27198_10950 [Methylocystis echinoides]|uniref:Uncharacterized protein n=1 Tax=Methylocystis echinoides TaxID=29468 RepID=A0A9W6GSH3_9HYPH|nr:hypothetical protein LMG27198_10950 [Methylocystis echinoides]